jgi:EAL domain-containing protein (putative c-di-GMP-specific phosphodiesterase class I)
MYQAKAKSTHSAVFFTEDMNTRLRDRMQMEQDLNTAVELGQVALHFQPIVETARQRRVGAEVLLRWNHPERGLISPATFIPIAEATGQIVNIGDWVLEQTCRCWSDWRRQGRDPGFLAINISGVQLRKRFASRVAELMRQYGVPGRALELEITERVLLQDDQEVANELAALRALGVRLALDDFGTGYSALSYLKRFRFDVLKIDRSFVSGVPEHADDVSVVKAIIAMARGLELTVIGEGVETREQLSFLANQGCEFVQGYFFSRPVDAETYREGLEIARRSDERLPVEMRLVSASVG